MSETEINPAICPLCTKANKCGLVDGGNTCWCFSTSLAPPALERVPVEQQGLSCICRECGTRTVTN